MKRIIGTLLLLIAASIFLAGCGLPTGERQITDLGSRAITTSQTGTNNGFYYSFWTNGGGSSSMNLGDAGNYSVNWSNVGDFTCGKGWSTGSGHTISYNAGVYQNSGGGALALYGWTTNPLVEYYVCESWNGVTANSGTTQVGTVTTDGGTYTIYKHQQVNQPSIQGTATFWQYISVRNSQRTSGTITTQNHFNAWAQAGLNLGTHNYQIMLTEGWNGSGQSNVTVWEGGSGSATPTPTATPAPSSGSGGTAGRYECENLSLGGSYAGKISSPFSGVALYANGDYCQTGNIAWNNTQRTVSVRGCSNNSNAAPVVVKMNGYTMGTLSFSGTTPTVKSFTCTPQTGNYAVQLTVTSDNNTWDAFVDYVEISGTSGGGTTTPAPTATPGGTNGSVFLCFDDGPNNGTSATLVNALKNAGCNAATFFPIGQNIAGNGTGLSAYKNSGFSVQNHSQTHQHMTGWGYQQVYNDLQQANQAIQNAGFAKPSKVRLPYLESNSTIQSACSALGLSAVNPSVDTQDWNGASTQSIINACNNLQNGGNILAHDTYQTTIVAIPTIVQNLKNRGLGFAQY
jgi:peptidoglycan/xylan/chitin deacetylase (PgdA/CDA1 family)